MINSLTKQLFKGEKQLNYKQLPQNAQEHIQQVLNGTHSIVYRLEALHTAHDQFIKHSRQIPESLHQPLENIKRQLQDLLTNWDHLEKTDSMKESEELKQSAITLKKATRSSRIK